MVKLEALSEVVWHIEQLMDCWLSEQKPATRTLLDLLTESHSQFGNWCTNLRKDGAVEIRAEHLFDQIRQLMYGTDEQADVAAEVLVSGQMQAVEQVQKSLKHRQVRQLKRRLWFHCRQYHFNRQRIHLSIQISIRR